jgi:hypothetical protein
MLPFCKKEAKKVCRLGRVVGQTRVLCAKFFGSFFKKELLSRSLARPGLGL